jgi:prepilin-type N-terminal cleavage/methylation domain-containing protein
MSDEQGYTLVELVTVLALLGVVVAALTTLFVGGTRAEVDLNNRFQAQNDAVMALDRLRRDVHCASSATAATATAVTLAAPCVAGGVVQWCTAGSTAPFSLHRLQGTGPCTVAASRYADNLTTSSVFVYDDGSVDNLPRIRVDLPVRVGDMRAPYRLCDILVMRNGTRAGAATVVPPCV